MGPLISNAKIIQEFGSTFSEALIQNTNSASVTTVSELECCRRGIDSPEAPMSAPFQSCCVSLWVLNHPPPGLADASASADCPVPADGVHLPQQKSALGVQVFERRPVPPSSAPFVPLRSPSPAGRPVAEAPFHSASLSSGSFHCDPEQDRTSANASDYSNPARQLQHTESPPLPSSAAVLQASCGNSRAAGLLRDLLISFLHERPCTVRAQCACPC